MTSTRPYVLIYFQLMYYSDSELRERHAFIERSVEATLEGLKKPEVVKDLGSTACELYDLFSNFVVADNNYGMLDLPSSAHENSVPLVAVERGEPVLLGPTFNTQTASQKEVTIATFKDWQPRHESADQIYNDMTPRLSMFEPVAWNEKTLAQTGLKALLLSGKHDLVKQLKDAPSRGFTLMKMRPIILLPFGAYPNAPPDVTTHEAIHYRAVLHKPLVTYHSARSVTATELRGELEAYHVGSALSVQDYREMGDGIDLTQIGSRELQILVETIRFKHNKNSRDPYNASKALLADLAKFGMDSILHMALDYDATLASVEEYHKSRIRRNISGRGDRT